MFRIPRRILSVSLLTLLTLPSAARADYFLHFWENQHELQHDFRVLVNAGYYQSPNDFDGAGNLIIPTGFQKYSRIETDALFSYGLSSRISVYGRAGWMRVQVDHDTLGGSTFGPTDGSAGVSLRAYEGKATVDFQLQGDFPLYSNPSPGVGAGPALGDATVDITTGGFLSVPVALAQDSALILMAGAGYTYRTNSYSQALPWNLSALYKPREEGLFAQASLLGLLSLRSDPRVTTITASTTALSASTGGSFITNAVNPSLLTLRGSAGYQFSSNVSVGLSIAQSVWGQAAPNGFTVGAFLQARLGRAAKGDGSHLSPKDYGKSNQGFINYGLEAHVTRTNDRLNLVKIDRGSQDGVAVGQTFDIFKTNKDGSTGEAVARGRVTSVLSSEGAVTIDEYFKEIWIDEGFVAKRPIQ